MKHTPLVTLTLLTIFFSSQIAGLFIVSQYVNVSESAASGKTVLNEGLYLLEPPRVENESTSFVTIFVLIILGTLAVLLLIKFRQRRLWKLWFFASVVIALAFAFVPLVSAVFSSFLVFLKPYSSLIAVLLALAFAVWKVFFPNVIVHNFTELFIYGGIAALLIPIINLVSAFALLLLIALYDMYAVWKSKHMVAMAEFQSSERLFAGLLVPYSTKSGSKHRAKPTHSKLAKKTHSAARRIPGSARTAVLGGGDIAFPLLFSSALLKHTGTFLAPLLSTAFATLALLALFSFAKKDRFYPAMPFLSLGCYIGAGIYFLL